MQDVEDSDSQLASAAKKRRRAEQDDIEFPDEVRPAAWLCKKTIDRLCNRFSEAGHSLLQSCCVP